MKQQGFDIAIDVRSDIDRLERKLHGVPGGIKRASVRAINRTLTMLRTEGTRIASESYTAKTKAIRSNISIVRATGRNPAGRVLFEGKQGIPLYGFRVRPRKQDFKGIPVSERKPWEGISAMIKRGGKYKTRYGHDGQKTFIATTQHGMTGVFYRRTNTGAKGGKLDLAFGPGPILALMNRQAKHRLDEKANTAFAKNITHEVDAILQGFAK